MRLRPRLTCDTDHAAAANNSLRLGTVPLYSPFGVHELLPVRRHASNGSLQTPLVHLLGPSTRCRCVDRGASAIITAASLVTPSPTCAVLRCASCRPAVLAFCRRVTSAAADVLSRLVSIGGVALALQLQLTTPLLQSFPAPNYYVSCRVSSIANPGPSLDPAAYSLPRRCDWHALFPCVPSLSSKLTCQSERCLVSASVSL